MIKTKTKKKTKTKSKKVNNNYKKLYQNIYNSIPKNIFGNKDGIEECAIAIYLTAMGVRPACAPFDGDIKRGGLSGNKMFETMTTSKIGKASLNKLNKINRLKVLIGPYYDTGNSILIVNNSNYPKLKPLLNKITTMSHKDGKKHILIGKMFGYTCPINLKKFWTNVDKGKNYYNITFRINNTDQMGVFCPLQNKHIKTAMKQLKDMKDVLNKIDKNIELIISIE